MSYTVYKNGAEEHRIKIKDLRTISGLSQSAFGKKYGIPTRSIQNWENGVRECPQYVITLLARAVKEDFEEGR